MVDQFSKGENVNELSKKFNVTKLTTTRNLKKKLGDEKYKEFFDLSVLNNKRINSGNDLELKESDKNFTIAQPGDESWLMESFMEIAPLDYEIDNVPQKDLSSVSIDSVDFPNILYMVVDKSIELSPKLLKDYAQWSFLPEEDLSRKTIEVFFDLKTAKRFCNKEQRVIKVPNPNVFKITAPILLSRGISRIISSDKLIAL